LHCFVKKLRAGTRPVTKVAQGASPPAKLFAPLEKFVGHSLKLLDTVLKYWAPLRKLFVPPGVPSWLWAWQGL